MSGPPPAGGRSGTPTTGPAGGSMSHHPPQQHPPAQSSGSGQAGGSAGSAGNMSQANLNSIVSRGDFLCTWSKSRTFVIRAGSAQLQRRFCFYHFIFLCDVLSLPRSQSTILLGCLCSCGMRFKEFLRDIALEPRKVSPRWKMEWRVSQP